MYRFKNCGVVPVIVLDRVEDAVPLAKALLAGGIDVAEVTFRTAAAQDSIAAIAAEVPEMLVGAGTIVTVEQAVAAVEAGAKFLVSPGLDAEVVLKAQELNVPIVPGAVTPSEIMQGLKLGIEVFKFFPANVYGGLKGMRALAAPFTKISFIPTGGIDQNNLGEYLAYNRIWACGGSWVCPADMVKSGDWDGISALSGQARSQVRSVRG